MGRTRKSYPGAILSLDQIAAAERLYQQLKEWHRPFAALEMINTKLPGFDIPTTLLKTVAVNALLGTQIFALVAMAAHVQNVLGDISVETAGLDLVDKLADFKHKNKGRECVSFASKFAHFFINADRFPMKDSYSTRMVEFHLGTQHCIQVERQVADKSYAAFVGNIEQLKNRYGLDISYHRLDRYLWFAGKYRFALHRPPFEKSSRSAQAQRGPGHDGLLGDVAKDEFLDSLSAHEYRDDLAALLG